MEPMISEMRSETACTYSSAGRMHAEHERLCSLCYLVAALRLETPLIKKFGFTPFLIGSLLAFPLPAASNASAGEALVDAVKRVVTECERGASAPALIGEETGKITFVPLWHPEKTLELAESGKTEAMIAIADCLLERSKPDQGTEGRLSEFLQDKNQLAQGRDALRANAIIWYEKAIDRNDPIAMKKRAELLINGSSSEDRSSAIILYKKSAELGNQEAIRFLWGAYLSGDLVLQDYSEAYKYLSQGAELGDAYSQYELGQLLSEKRGYPEDLVAAYKWFILANVLGSSNSKKDEIQKRMTSEQVLEGQAQARKWMEEMGRSIP